VSKVCALVGVGSGLGMAIARRFGREGYRLALLARREEELAEHAAALQANGIKALGFSVDAADSAALIGVFKQIRQSLGDPDVLVYNVAALKQSSLLTITAEELVQDFRANVAGALTSIQQVVGGMQKQRRGTILLTGGGLALDPSPQFASLALSKAAIRNLSFSFAKELKESGVHVATVTICGAIESGTRFDPDKIAQAYWELHAQGQGSWDREYVYQ
jgi:short-subunit dehydrogenase